VAPVPGQNPFPSLQRPSSPTSSVRTNASTSITTLESASAVPSQAYQQFPSQAARIPPSHAVHLDTQQHGSSIHLPQSSAHPSSSRVNGDYVENFGDLHLSGSEPRIFPGIVSRTQRRDSVRKGSMNENDEPQGLTIASSKRATSVNGTLSADSTVDVLEESD